MLAAAIMLLLQVASAQLTGTVVDSRGGPVPGASIVLTEVNTNAEIRAVSENSGTYTVFPVKPGLYRVTVEASGFQRVVRERVRLSTGERVRLNFDVAVSVGNQSVTVTADASMLRDASANLGQVVDSDRIVDLPLNGR